MTNHNEGNIFVDVNKTLMIMDYVSQLFTDVTFPQVQEATYVYQNYGTAVEQAITVMSDCAISDLAFKSNTWNLISYSNFSL